METRKQSNLQILKERGWRMHPSVENSFIFGESAASVGVEEFNYPPEYFVALLKQLEARAGAFQFEVVS